MKDFISFLKTKTFFKHFGLALLVLALILFLLFKLLAVYTNHAETVDVPDFKGQSISALEAFVEDKEVQYEIVDSLYLPGEKPGVVVKQDPAAKTKVKHNRIIYLYVSSVMPPMIEMPQLMNKTSLRQAMSLIQSYGLKVGKIKRVTGDCDGCVLRQFVDGKEQDFKVDAKGNKPRFMVKKGSRVDLEVGEGQSEARTVVPDLIGERLSEAMKTLAAEGLSGSPALDAPSKDSLSMFVYKLDPPSGSSIRIGSVVNIFVTTDKSKLVKEEGN